MTVALNPEDLATRITASVPGAVISFDTQSVIVTDTSLYKVAEFLKKTQGLDFDYLNDLTAVDYIEYFDVVYHLSSLEHNHSAVIKARCMGRDNLSVPSVVSLWRSADFMEREVFDLLGITFTGHPNMKRLFLWEGFEGHPLRRDYL